MAPIPEPLDPTPGERGRASGDLATLAGTTLRSWDLFLAAARQSDLEAPARAHGWTGREVLLIVGDWPENRGLNQIVADARAGVTGDIDQAADVAAVHAARSAVSDEQAIGAVERSRDLLADWFVGDGPAEVGLLPTRSLLGTLPVLTLLQAMSYQLAVSALDLVPCGADHPAELVDLGLQALVDTTGALAARADTTASLTARTPSLVVGAGARGGSWRTAVLDPDQPSEGGGPAIVAEGRTILDITSGRASNVPGLYRSGELQVVDLPGLLALAPVISDVPGIPGGTALGRALTFMNSVGSLLGRLPFGRR